MNNPFEPINARLNNLEALALEVLQLLRNNGPVAASVEESPLTVQQAADLLDVTTATIYDLVHKRRIPSHRPGKRLYFLREELMQWIRDGRRMTTDELASIATIRPTRQDKVRKKGGVAQ